MSRRNFIILLIILSVLVVVLFGSLYFRTGSVIPTSPGTGTNFFSQFNPFGSSTTTPPTTTPPADVSGYVPPVTPETPVVKLRKVSSMPIAGFTSFLKERLKDVPVPAPLSETANTDTTTPATNTTTTTKIVTKKTTSTAPATEFALALRYVERATGNIYQTFTDKIEERKFSSTIIPQVYDAYFGNKGMSVVMRHLEGDYNTIETFAGNLPREYLGADTTVSNEIKGSFLPEGITDISLSSDGSKIFYLFNTGDSVVGIIFDLLTNKKTQVFDSAFTEWLSSWPNSKMITMTTKPAGSVLGYMYSFDPATKNLVKALGDINGLTTLSSPNGKLILVSDSSLTLSLYSTDTKDYRNLGVQTLPEKCVWNRSGDTVYCAVPRILPDGIYPDFWYQGQVSFSDEFWKINIATGIGTLLSDPVTVGNGEEIDGIKLALDDDENYLFFVNKKDSFLWELNLK